MELTKHLANRFREVIFDGDWIANTNYLEQLSKVTWKQAATKIGSLNTIEAITFHINYYIAGILKVFNGGTLDIKDRYSFDFIPLQSEKEWNDLLNSLWDNAEQFDSMIRLMPDNKLTETFTDEKYGSYQRNIEGMIEHCYYHLGQITLIKKMIMDSEGD